MAFIKSIATLILVLILTQCGVTKISQQTPFITVSENQLKALYPKSEKFTIDPTIGQILKTQKGTSISIEKNSFSLNSITIQDKVILTVTEAIDNSDFLGVGINLNMDREIFESSGMIKMEAKSNGKEISLDKNITVKMPNHSGEEEDFNIYSFKNGKWGYKGSNQQAGPDDSQGLNTVEVYGYANSSYYRINSILSDYSWWNFDKPMNQIICVRGRFKLEKKDARNYVAVSVLGVDYKGVYTKYVQNDSFEINAPRHKRVKLLFYDNMQMLGITDVFMTWDTLGFNYSIVKGNECQDIGEIELKNYDEDFWKSKEKINNLLNI
ncbi:MAG: hypothetical protein GW938_07890 [Leptospira sp.]|nr:hypothetical protein [Leptospira sp.]NCS93154.1 hypothetical protein [Leptospira sp.]